MELKCFTPTQTLADRSGQKWWLMCENRKWKIVCAKKLLLDVVMIFNVLSSRHFILSSFNFLSYYMGKTDSQIENSFKHTKRSSSSKVHLNWINLLFQHSLLDSSLTFDYETTIVRVSVCVLQFGESVQQCHWRIIPNLQASRMGINLANNRGEKNPTCFCDVHNKGLEGSYWQD